MKNHIYQKLSKFLFPMAIIILIFLIHNFLFSRSDEQEKQEHQIQKAKIFQEIYPIISESDLYCSFLVLDEENMDIEIVGGERDYEKTLFTDFDIVYINKGKSSGLENEQLFLIIEIGPQIKDIGHIAFKRGRARIQDLGEIKCTARIEKSCGPVVIGNFLVPFQEKESMLGKDLGYDVPPEEVEGLKGNLIYLQDDYNQVGSGHWALIDIGEEEGVYFGQQLIIYRKLREGAPIQVLGNSVVIDVQEKTSTIKILSCEDALKLGDHIQARS